MPYNLPLTEIESSCRTSSDCPLNFPALFTSSMWPFTSYPEGTAASLSDGRGESSVARKVCPGCAFSESIGSSSRTAIHVPICGPSRRIPRVPPRHYPTAEASPVSPEKFAQAALFRNQLDRAAELPSTFRSVALHVVSRGYRRVTIRRQRRVQCRPKSLPRLRFFGINWIEQPNCHRRSRRHRYFFRSRRRGRRCRWRGRCCLGGSRILVRLCVVCYSGRRRVCRHLRGIWLRPMTRRARTRLSRGLYRCWRLRP